MTKNQARKIQEQIQERTHTRRPIFNPTMQLFVVNLYIKFEVSILNSCEDIFDEKSGEKRKDKIRDEQIGEGLFSFSRCNLSL